MKERAVLGSGNADTGTLVFLLAGVPVLALTPVTLCPANKIQKLTKTDSLF